MGVMTIQLPLALVRKHSAPGSGAVPVVVCTVTDWTLLGAVPVTWMVVVLKSAPWAGAVKVSCGGAVMAAVLVVLLNRLVVVSVTVRTTL